MTDDEHLAWAQLFELPLPETEEATPADEPRRRGLFTRLKESLTKPRQAISPQLAGLYQAQLVEESDWEDLEDALIGADCGVEASGEIVSTLRARTAMGRIAGGRDLAHAVWEEIATRMGDAPPRVPLGRTPTVILVVGVNGSGKTTTVGKLAHRLAELGQHVVIGAADTFRAAAIDQLAIWAERSGAQLVRQAHGADPGAVAYDAVAAGVARRADVVLIDTAGRLQTQRNLMEELRKVAGVTSKLDPTSPHEVLLVLDATTGQNGLSQAELFAEAVGVTGVVLTKLDGTAKGGIVIPIHRRLGIPVKVIGTGEALADLQPFAARDFARAIFGDEPVAG